MICADKEKDDLELFYDEFFKLPGLKRHSFGHEHNISRKTSTEDPSFHITELVNQIVSGDQFRIQWENLLTHMN